MADSPLSVTKSITAQNTFTDSLILHGSAVKRFTATVEAGTHSATPTIQFRVKGQTAWSDLDTNNFPALVNIGAARTGELNGDFEVRVGVKTGDYTSGTMVVFLTRSL